MEEVAGEVDGTVEDRGHKLVIHLPTGGSVWCASTPSHPAPDRVRRDVRRELAKGSRR